VNLFDGSSSDGAEACTIVPIRAPCQRAVGSGAGQVAARTAAASLDGFNEPNAGLLAVVILMSGSCVQVTLRRWKPQPDHFAVKNGATAMISNR
jgi:hypothetical protein